MSDVSAGDPIGLADPAAAGQHSRERLAEMVASAGVVVLSGAGLSTDSGIPDYRSREGVRRIVPITWAEFLANSAQRQRFWARSHVGWPIFRQAEPNVGHLVVAQLQDRGLVAGVVTQNIDGLHQRAGSHDVVELHGRLAVVVCLDCRRTEDCDQLDHRLDAANPGFRERLLAPQRPDGDVELGSERVARFVPPRCAHCGSDRMAPEVVFFGGSVPAPVLTACQQLVADANSLLVLGSSLQTMSGLRLVRQAAAAGKPVAIVTRGITRGDPLACLCIDADLGRTLTFLDQALDSVGGTSRRDEASGPHTRRSTATTLPRIVASDPSMGE